MTIKLNSGKITLLIDDVSSNPSDWKIVQSELYRPDRQEFLLNKFKEDFPKQANAVNSFELLSSLASRSKRVNEWLVSASAQYILEVSAPLYLKGILSSEDYSKAQKNISELNRNANERVKEEQAIVQNYKSAMSSVAEKYNKKNSNLIKDKVVRILTLSSQSLPITLQLMIENFKPADTTRSPDKKTYAREILTNFKISLLKYFTSIENKDEDLEDFLIEISEK